MSTTYVITLIGIGIGAGFLSGLVGIGGGVIIVPALVIFLGFTQHQAQGTSLGVLSMPVVILGFITYYQSLKNGNDALAWQVILLIAVGFIFGAWGGGKIAQQLNQETLKKIFGFLLLYIGLKFVGVEKYIVQLFKR